MADGVPRPPRDQAGELRAHALQLPERPGFTDLLNRAVEQSSRALWPKEAIAAIDASGIPHRKGKNWSNDRGKPDQHKLYDKLHVLIGTKPLVIAAAWTTFGNWHDAPKFLPQVEAVDEWITIKALTADAGNVSRTNYDAVQDRGVRPYIDPKENALLRSKPSDA